MSRGGWEHLNKRCPKKGCDGELFAKGAGPQDNRGNTTKVTHMAVKCSKGDFEKRDREAAMEKWISQQSDKRKGDDD
jgi:hypothetical protein